ncbi:MAG TPA: hypothetical protein VNA25_25110 [Phycisphaerae bacterium]|nr:hypothetical protein [Phycisphaerae bacterium]
MSKNTVAIVGLCALAGGLLLGLVTASLTSGSLGEVTAERDRLAQELAKTRAEVVEVRAAGEHLRRVAVEATKLIREGTKLINDREAARRAAQEAGEIDVDREQVAGRDSETDKGRTITWRIRSGNKTTKTFRVNRGEWEVSWKIISGAGSDCEPWLWAFVTRADGHPVDGWMGSENGSSIVRAPPGDFYLKLGVVACEAEFTATW